MPVSKTVLQIEHKRDIKDSLRVPPPPSCCCAPCLKMFSFFVLCSSYEDPDKCLLLYGDDQVGVEGRRGHEGAVGTDSGARRPSAVLSGRSKGEGSEWENLFLEGEAQVEEREEEIQRYGKCVKF